MNKIQKVVAVTFALIAQGTVCSAINNETLPPPLTPVEKTKVQYLLKQISSFVKASPQNCEGVSINLGEVIEQKGDSKLGLPAAKSAYVELRAWGRRFCRS